MLYLEKLKEISRYHTVNLVLDLKMKNESSLDPKIAFKFNLSEIALRLSRGSAFSMPSMAQMYSSEMAW